MDKALRAGRARLAGLRALRLELAPLGRPGPARDHAGPHGRHVVLAVAAGDGAEHRDVRRADWDTDPLRLPLDGYAPRGRAGRGDVRSGDDRWRISRRDSGLRGRRVPTAFAVNARDRILGPLRRYPP